MHLDFNEIILENYFDPFQSAERMFTQVLIHFLSQVFFKLFALLNQKLVGDE